MFFLFKKIFFYLLCTFSLIVLIGLLTRQIEKKKAKFSIDNNIKYIVLGHSHPSCAFNDSLIPRFLNFGNSQESYLYTYVKLKQILKNKNSLEAIFLEFTNNQITSEMDSWTWGQNILTRNYPIYSAFMDTDEEQLILNNNMRGYLNSKALTIKEQLYRILNNDFNFTNKIGGYLYLDLNKTDSFIHHLPSALQRKRPIQLSEMNLFYLSKIVDLCAFYKKKLILIRSPQHEAYLKCYIDNYEVLYKNKLRERAPNIEYLDFSAFPLNADQFGDLEHLNFKGAKIFSKWFEKLLFEHEILLRSNKQFVIDSLIALKK